MIRTAQIKTSVRDIGRVDLAKLTSAIATSVSMITGNEAHIKSKAIIPEH